MKLKLFDGYSEFQKSMNCSTKPIYLTGEAFVMKKIP